MPPWPFCSFWHTGILSLTAIGSSDGTESVANYFAYETSNWPSLLMRQPTTITSGCGLSH